MNYLQESFFRLGRDMDSFVFKHQIIKEVVGELFFFSVLYESL